MIAFISNGRRRRDCRRRARGGYSLVMFALAIIALIGMAGLVVEGGLMMAHQRQAQNAADAAARAAAVVLHRGGSNAEATTVANNYVYGVAYNNVPTGAAADLQVNIPPATGPYAASPPYNPAYPNFVEVIVPYPVPVVLMRVLGFGQQVVYGRAVAGFVAQQQPAGLVTLDPEGNPGLNVSGSGASLTVNASVYVNSLRFGQYTTTAPTSPPIINSGQAAASIGGGATIRVEGSLVVAGGVDRLDNFTTPGVAELVAGTALPLADPFWNSENQLPTPTINNGVIDRDLGSVTINGNNVKGLTPPNVSNNSGTTLYPGIYNQITINNGNVTFSPGIYVLKPKGGGGNVLSISGGTVLGNGIMFYNTGSSYDPAIGSPDNGDNNPPASPPALDARPTVSGNEKFGGISISNTTMTLRPIDTTKYSYPDSRISAFNQMLIYQRRFNQQTISISNGPPNGLLGNLYAKWAQMSLAGNGTYNFQAVMGTLSVNGQATFTIPSGTLPVPVQAQRVVLVQGPLNQ